MTDIIEIDQSFDASKLINKLTVIGMGPGSTHLEVTVEDSESQARHGVMEGTFSAKDIHDIDTLTSYANAMLDQTKEAKHRMTVKLAGTERTDFELGDTVHIDNPDAGIDGNYRIISMERVSGVDGEYTKLEVASPQFRVTETLMDAKRRLDADEYHPQGAPSIITLEKSENVNSTHPLTMEFYVPEQAVDMGKLQIREAKIALTLEPFRAHSTGAASGGGHTSGASSTSTTAGGGGQTSSGGSSHSHTVSGQTAQSKDLGVKNSGPPDPYSYTQYNRPYEDGTSYGWKDVYDAFFYDGNLVRDVASMNKECREMRHRHYVGTHTHSVTLGSHDHSVTGTTSASESSHTHTVSDHTHGMEHTHQIQNHTHGIVYGIYTSTYPTSVYIKLNGEQIAGPFNSKSYVDITTEFLDKITTYGWNTLEFTTTQLGKIGVTLFMSLFLQAS